jgi:hypothetical protein
MASYHLQNFAIISAALVFGCHAAFAIPAGGGNNGANQTTPGIQDPSGATPNQPGTPPPNRDDGDKRGPANEPSLMPNPPVTPGGRPLLTNFPGRGPNEIPNRFRTNSFPGLTNLPPNRFPTNFPPGFPTNFPPGRPTNLPPEFRTNTVPPWYRTNLPPGFTNRFPGVTNRFPERPGLTNFFRTNFPPVRPGITNVPPGPVRVQ